MATLCAKTEGAVRGWVHHRGLPSQATDTLALGTASWGRERQSKGEPQMNRATRPTRGGWVRIDMVSTQCTRACKGAAMELAETKGEVYG